MRILQVMAGNKHGGAETAYVDTCIAMKEAGHAVAAVTRSNDMRVPRLEAADIQVFTLPFGGKIDVYTPFKIKQIIKNFKPDIVQSWMSRGPSKVPNWSQTKGLQRYIHVGRMGSPYKFKYFKTCDAFVAITPDLKKYIHEHGVEQEAIKHINNFAEVDTVQTPIKRSDYQTPDDATVLLGLGRLHDDKAFDVLIRAVAALPDKFYAWIAGEGPLRPELEALIAELGVQDRVRLLGWQSDRAALFEQTDICCFISRNEGFGTVFVQSWALETPVIVSEADGPRQFVTDGTDGLVVTIDDVQALETAILKLDSDKNLQDKLIANGKNHYDRAFTKRQSIQDYIDFYTSLMGKDDK